MARFLPKLVTKLCFMHEAWIVGSAVDKDNPKDYDVLVPWFQWEKAATLIPPTAAPNTFGGWRCTEDEAFIDVWPGDLASFLSIGMVRGVWHPRSGRKFILTEGKLK